MTVHMPSIDGNAATCVIRMRDVARKVNLSESHLYQLIADGRFPKPFPLVPGGRAKGWLETTIESYLVNQAALAGDQK